MQRLVKVLVVCGLISALSACAMKGPCESAKAPARSEGMMKQYGGK